MGRFKIYRENILIWNLSPWSCIRPFSELSARLLCCSKACCGLLSHCFITIANHFIIILDLSVQFLQKLQFKECAQAAFPDAGSTERRPMLRHQTITAKSHLPFHVHKQPRRLPRSCNKWVELAWNVSENSVMGLRGNLPNSLRVSSQEKKATSLLYVIFINISVKFEKKQLSYFKLPILLSSQLCWNIIGIYVKVIMMIWYM